MTPVVTWLATLAVFGGIFAVGKVLQKRERIMRRQKRAQQQQPAASRQRELWEHAHS